MNVLLRLNDGLVDLNAFDAVRVAERAGHPLLIGENTGQLTEHVLAFFDRQHPTEDKPGKLLDAIAEAITSGVAMLDCRDLTIRATDQMQADIAMRPDDAEPGEEEQPAREVMPRLVFRLRRGDSTPKELQMLRGRRVSNVEMSGEFIGLICDEE